MVIIRITMTVETKDSQETVGNALFSLLFFSPLWKQ